VQRGLRGPRVTLALPALKVLRALQAPLVPLEPRATLALPALKVLPALLVPLVPLVLRATRALLALLAPLVPLARQVQRVPRVRAKPSYRKPLFMPFPR